MIKLIKTIVDPQRQLIGFVVSGKEKELGGVSNAEVERSILVDAIIKDKFTNTQISVIKNKIVEKGNFKINSLPMTVYTGETFIDIPNTVELIQRFVRNNENIGFRVRFADGGEDNILYTNLIFICKWFKPANFAIRTSSNNKQYICGKEGLNIDKLPSVVLGEESKAKRTKSAAKEVGKELNTTIETGFDILDIYDFIKSCGGCVIKLPTENYVAASEGGETVTEGFVPLGIGEVALPNPQFNAVKINVNASFKKVGVVPVVINGATTNLTSFVYRTKSIFLNGDNYMKKFGIAVPSDKEAELVKALGASLGLEKITDNTITAPLGQVIDAKSLVFYKVNTDKIDLINKEKRNNSIMNARQLMSICKKQYELKLISKAIGNRAGLIKEFLNELNIPTTHDSKLFGIYSMMNEESLKAVKEAGIDIYTGAFTTPGKPVYNKASKGSEGTTEEIEIEYMIKGLDISKITGKQVLEAVLKNDTTKVTANIIKTILPLLDKNKSTEEKLKMAEEVNSKIEKELYKINRQLWMHNASMFIEGNRSKVHTHDAKSWAPDTTSRVKTAKVYAYNGKTAEGLIVKIKGTEI